MTVSAVVFVTVKITWPDEFEVVPPGATVAVVSKGDGELLKLEGRRAWHFPQGEDGTYAGHYPANSDACIAELERLRSRGAEFLVIPATAQWWLRYYGQFGEHLQTCYRALGDERSPATIFALSRRRISGAQISGLIEHGRCSL